MKHSVELSDEFLLSLKDQPNTRKPIVMVNLLQFRPQAEYGDGETSCSGEQAYSQYAKAVIPLILEVGGYPVWAGKVRSTLIGRNSEQWDQVALVAYPSRKAFVDMHLNQAYIDCVEHRNAGLQDVRLIETRPTYFPRLILRLVGLVFRVKALFIPRELVKKSVSETD